ncbi:hypothetical protein [Microvirga lenta]|uniref:hypothetical protein n=1 Tax=Microvirga lenta TaxID=2881337 RepID=UPI001CFF9327|nr:hypothetical protein [Microvirga lenta]MCB5175362.1 hypothetical protein [Microvirga lenta]
MAAMLSRISLRFQILTTCLVGVVGILALALVYVIGSGTAEQQRRAAAAATKLELLVVEIDADLLNARRAEKDFFLRADEKYAARHAEIVEEAQGDLKEAHELTGSSAGGDLLAKVTQIEKGIGAYAERFRNSVALRQKLGLNEESGLQGSLRGSVRAVEKKLAEFDEPRLMILMLMMRRHEKDFMLRLDAKYGEEMKKRADEFAKALSTSTLAPATRSDVAAAMAAYQRDFAAYMETQLKLAEEMKSVSSAYAEFEPTMDEVKKAAEEV